MTNILNESMKMMKTDTVYYELCYDAVAIFVDRSGKRMGRKLERTLIKTISLFVFKYVIDVLCVCVCACDCVCLAAYYLKLILNECFVYEIEEETNVG